MKTWIMYVIGTIICWGAYVPTIHAGQVGFGEPKGPLRAFLFVGLTYCLVAALIPAYFIFVNKAEPAIFPTKGMAISTLAGVFGALGALGVIFALKSGGTPQTVPSLVFAGAPIVATIIGMAIHRPTNAPSPMFYVGIVMAAVGAGLVLRFKPV
jgi:hypothetical protein